MTRLTYFLVLAALFPSSALGSLKDRPIVLDAGHGVINYQADIINAGQMNRDGRIEHKVAFEIMQKVGQLLAKEGARVIYTRTPLDYWRQAYNTAEDNKNRALFANEMKAEALLSIHCDWDPRPKINGVTTLYETAKSRRLGELIHRSLVRELRSKDRMVVKDNFTILDHAEMPALIIETGFLSNRAEGRKLANPAYQARIAKAIVGGLKTFFKN